jgi:hypothetical protein
VERYVVILSLDEETHDYLLSQAQWERLAPGDQITAQRSRLGTISAVEWP